jgi:peptide-methionine (R)-S-oxide reductase
MQQFLTTYLSIVLLVGCSYAQPPAEKKSNNKKDTMPTENTNKPPVYDRGSEEKLVLSNEEWKKMLSPEVYYIARQKGTERPWTSRFEGFKEKGTYYCAACGNPLFVSDTKFESGCGWPSFYEPISKKSIIYQEDRSHGMVRTEVMCGRCEAHLGHVFDDGPPPTGMRYCINGVILDFEKAEKAEKDYQKKNQ